MTQGVITLLYKGKGSRSLMHSYRPTNLLNSDYRLLAKALLSRFGPALQHVVDLTQTAFVPGRWIGDNVLLPPGRGCVPSTNRPAWLHSLLRL